MTRHQTKFKFSEMSGHFLFIVFAPLNKML